MAGIICIVLVCLPVFCVSARGDGSSSGGTQEALDLGSLFALLLDSNREIQVQKLEQDISAWSIEAEEGIFEPVFSVDISYGRGERVNTQEEQAGQSSGLLSPGPRIYRDRNLKHRAGINGLLPSGAEYSIGCTFDRLENTVNSFHNEYDAFAGVDFRQPLLRNFGSGIPDARVRLARKEYEIQHQKLRRQIGDLVVVAEQTYWELRLKHEQVQMRVESSERAEKMLLDFRERLKAGKASTLEVYQAETGLSLRRTQVDTARQEYLEAANNLRSLLADPADNSRLLLVPREALTFEPAEVDAAEALTLALGNNPDYLALRRQVEQDAIRIEVARDALQPALDFVSSYGVNANGTEVQRAFNQFQTRDYETWSVGIHFSVPLGGGKRARSGLAAARLRKRQKSIRLRDLETQLINRLDTIKGRLLSLNARLKSISNAVAYNERLLDVAMVRLSEGKDDVRRVLEIEEDLVEARDNRLRTLLECREALLDWEYVQGTVLRNRGIEVSMLPDSRR